MDRDRHQLTTVVVGDEPDGWATAGFTVHDDCIRIGSTTIVCDPSVGQGIAAVGIDGLIDTVDGLPIGLVDAPITPAAEHHNRVTGFDHLVAMSPSIDRTADALIDAGLQRRRTRRFEMGGETRRQDFFWLGDVILELVGVEGVEGQATQRFGAWLSSVTTSTSPPADSARGWARSRMRCSPAGVLRRCEPRNSASRCRSL